MPGSLASIGLDPVWHSAGRPFLGLTTLYFAPFIIGALAGIVPAQSRTACLLQGRLGLLLSVVAISLEFATQETAYAFVPNIRLGRALLPIALGNTLATTLTRRSVQFLGAISCDIYLLHRLALYCLLAV